MPGLRGAPAARVAIPQGTIYPDGLPLIAPDPGAQATVRPEGWFFRQSAGYHTIRPGGNRYDPNFFGPGIGFTPMRFAEDISAYDTGKGLPPIVSQDDAFLHADISEIPGSGMLDSSGRISSADDVQANQGIFVGQGKRTPHHDGVSDIHLPLFTGHDEGDREPGRPLTRMKWAQVLSNPLGAFREEYRHHPITAVGVAAAGITLAYMIGRDFENSYERRRGRGAVGAAAGAAPAATETAGTETSRATNVVAEVVEDTGKAVETVTSDIADAIS
jgi:hypothetical protein